MPVLWHSGKRDLKKKTNFFPECLNCGTRQRVFKKKFKNLSRVLHSGKKIKKKENGVGRRPTASSLPRVAARHSTKPSPSARFSTLREGAFPVGGLAGGSSPSVALGEGFPECNWHSGKPAVPVVHPRAFIFQIYVHISTLLLLTAMDFTVATDPIFPDMHA